MKTNNPIQVALDKDDWMWLVEFMQLTLDGVEDVEVTQDIQRFIDIFNGVLKN